MKAGVFFVLSFILSLNGYGQGRGNIWCFADSILMDFNSGNPVLGYSNFSTSVPGSFCEVAASIADEQGNLLFYSNGETIWNKIHDTIENGSGLFSNYSITQGALILPQPMHDSIYFIFYFDSQIPDFGLYYSIINQALDNGKGGIAANSKNIQLLDVFLAEKLTSVKHANGIDWWILVHSMGNASFYKLLLTEDGIELNDIQSIGTIFQGTVGFGEMNFSQDGSKLCVVNTTGFINVFDFDRCTGQLSNFTDLTIAIEDLGSYSCSFSKDGNLLYVVKLSNNLFQFDLASFDIPGSRILIWTNPLYSLDCTDSVFLNGQMQLAPDGKIYMTSPVCVVPADVSSYYNTHLHVIKEPNLAGSLCNFAPWDFDLGTRKASLGFPNMPNYNLGPLEGSLCDTLTTISPIEEENNYTISLYPNPVKNVLTINYDLKDKDGALIFYNIFGEKVATYYLNPSEDQLQFSTAHLNGGVYLYTIESDHIFSSPGKIIIQH